jgi:hypothetical protein
MIYPSSSDFILSNSAKTSDSERLLSSGKRLYSDMMLRSSASGSTKAMLMPFIFIQPRDVYATFFKKSRIIASMHATLGKFLSTKTNMAVHAAIYHSLILLMNTSISIYLSVNDYIL